MIWSSLRGHSAQIDMFRRAVQRGRTAHAYVFVGPEGVGKRLVARNIAQSLFCERIPDVQLDACGECPSCRQVRAGTHPDLLTVACPEGKRELPIELIAGAKENRGREGLCRDLALRPMSVSRRIAIIDDADKMNEESANALLKTLEEPPPGAILFLISPGIDALLPTIRSRCQPIHFSALSESDLAELLVQLDLEADPDAARRVAALSEGSLATARQLLDPELRKLRDAVYEHLSVAEFRSLETADALIALVEELGSDTAAQRQNAGWLLRFAVSYFRSALQQVATLHEAEPEESIRRFLTRCGDPVEAAERLAAMLDRCVLADLHLQQIMPVPLCLEGLCDDLSRIDRGAAALCV
jgi:DNA polymerase-3 subunit delta'